MVRLDAAFSHTLSTFRFHLPHRLLWHWLPKKDSSRKHRFGITQFVGTGKIDYRKEIFPSFMRHISRNDKDLEHFKKRNEQSFCLYQSGSL